MHANHQPIIVLVSPNPLKAYTLAFHIFFRNQPVQRFSGLIIITSSVCVHKIMEHADDLSKFLGWIV